MFTVIKKPLTPNIIWNGDAGKPLCDFGHKGMLETNDQELVQKLAAMGHTVTGEADAPAQQEQPDDADETAQDGADDMNNDEVNSGQQPAVGTADDSAQQTTPPATKRGRKRK